MWFDHFLDEADFEGLEGHVFNDVVGGAEVIVLSHCVGDGFVNGYEKLIVRERVKFVSFMMAASTGGQTDATAKGRKTVISWMRDATSQQDLLLWCHVSSSATRGDVFD